MFLKVMCLALLQGIAEFLPVSSSGHLVLGKHFLGMEMSAGVLLEVVLHAGTLCSIVVYYRSRIVALCLGVWRREWQALRYCLYIVVGSIPAAIAYILLGDAIEGLFSRPSAAAVMLCVTGLFLLSMRMLRDRSSGLSGLRAAAIGVAQAFAMVPGISRSGSTIATGRWLGLAPAAAAEFSFLMSLPALGGAALIEAVRVFRDGVPESLDVPSLGVGFVVSAVVGYVALSVLVNVLSAGRFWVFGIYCLGAGVVSLAVLL